MTVEAMVTHVLVGVIYPLWLCAGAADLLCHRRTNLALTSGVPESALHLAQLAAIGVAVLLVLFLKVTALVLVILAALITLHSALSFIDVAYTDERRRITPLEQHIHAYLEVLPWIGLLAVAVIHWPSIAAPDFGLHSRPTPLAPLQLAGILLPAALIAIVPAIAEFTSAWRNRPQASSMLDREVFSATPRAEL